MRLVDDVKSLTRWFVDEFQGEGDEAVAGGVRPDVVELVAEPVELDHRPDQRQADPAEPAGPEIDVDAASFCRMG